MEALIVTIFVSMVLVFLGLLLFAKSVKEGDFEHGDRLSLLPLEDESERFDARGDLEEEELT